MSASIDTTPAPRKRRSSRTAAKSLGGAGVSIHVPQIPRDSRGIAIGPVMQRPDSYVPNRSMSEDMPAEARQYSAARALAQFESSLPGPGHQLAALRPVLIGIATGRAMDVHGIPFDGAQARMELAKAAEPEQAYAAEWREHTRWYQTMSPDASMSRRDMIDPYLLAKHSNHPLAKSVLDVGVSQNFAQNGITGGQTLGYFSLDTRMARGTVRPDSFTLYQALAKSAAYQVIDYWPYIDDPGGALPGSATSGFSNVSGGTLPTTAGIYSLQSIELKLMLDGRAVTMALMAQNNFVSINEQENANSALTVLQTADWLCYHGNPAIFPNQFAGLSVTIPTNNTFDFQQFAQTNQALQGWSTAQTLFNMIYEVSAVVTSWGRFGRTTHAFMTPNTGGSLQSLVTTLLNQVTNLGGESRGLVVNGDLQGMLTRMGPIQFPMDLVITSRDIPAQGQPRSNGTLPTSTSNPTAPSTVTAAASGAAAVGSNWGVGAGSPYISGSAHYVYAAAATDVNMNESNLTFSSTPGIAGTAITSSGAAVVTITPAVADAIAFRVFRSGAGNGSTVFGTNGVNSPTALRFIGSVAASGASAVTFADLNTVVPGGERIYLLDMRAEDGALDYRYLLPLTRVELFAQNLFMPWAVCSIGAVRVRIPKFHAQILNYVPDNPLWNPLGVNN